MRILKYIILTILAIIALALIAAIFIPKKFHAEGNVQINKPIQEVYDYVKQLKTQELYTEWYKMDKNIIKHYEGIDGTVGAQVIWKSDEVGDGKQVIKQLLPPNRVEIDLHLMSPDADAALYYYDLKPIDENTTQVKMAVDGATPYPFNLMALFFDMNEVFQKNADNLKTILTQ